MTPTQEHLLVADIADDIVLTKEGGAALVLETTSLNFSLLSQKEQEATTFAYAAFLNSLSFPIQILIRTHKKDVSYYLNFLESMQQKQQNPKLRLLMSSYKDFVANIVKKRHVLEKQFLIVVPFSFLELGITPNLLLSLSPTKQKRQIPFSKDYVVKRAKSVLYPRRDHIIRQTGRLGLKLRQLKTHELLSLFLEIYKINKSLQPQNGDKKLNGIKNEHS